MSTKLLGGPIVDRDNFFEKYWSKTTKDEKWYFEMVYQQRKSGQLAESGGYNDQKVLRNRCGITNAVNKIKGIRCVLTQDVSVVRYAREVLNANVLGFGGRVSGMGVIEDLIDAFLETEYAETEERNQMIEKIDHLIQHDPACGKENLFDDLLEKWERGEYHD